MQLTKFVGDKVIVALDNWVRGPDGEQYLALWGVLGVVDVSEIFGLAPQKEGPKVFVVVGGRHPVMVPLRLVRSITPVPDPPMQVAILKVE